MRQLGKCSNAGVQDIVGILVGLLLLVPRLGGAATATTNTTGNEWSGWDPGVVVEIDLERRRITESLPFDVPFYLLTKPSEPLVPKLDPVAFLALSSRSALACNETQLPGQACGPYPTDLCRLPVTRVKEKVKDAGDPVEQIEISMPQLRPKQDYCLVVAIPREPSVVEKQLMQNIAQSHLQKMVNEIVNKGEVLTAERFVDLCSNTKAVIESDLRGRNLTLIPSQGPALVACTESAIEALFAQLVDEASIKSLRTSLGDAEIVLAQLKHAIPANETDPQLVAIRNLSTPEERYSYLGSPSPTNLSSLLSKVQVATWTAKVSKLKADLLNGWTTRATESATCNDPSKTLVAPPILRMRCFAVSELAEVDLALGSVANAQNVNGDGIAKLAASIAPKLVENLAVAATTWAKFEQRFRWYVSADMGFAHAWDIDESFAYTGVNFYGSPVNKKAPLKGFGRRLPFSRRLALVVGLPMSNLEDPSRKPIVAGKPLLLGAGVRLTNYLRLTAGGLIFDEADPDPLVDDTRGPKATPFASLSLDIDVAGIFMSFFTPR